MRANKAGEVAWLVKCCANLHLIFRVPQIQVSSQARGQMPVILALASQTGSPGLAGPAGSQAQRQTLVQKAGEMRWLGSRTAHTEEPMWVPSTPVGQLTTVPAGTHTWNVSVFKLKASCGATFRPRVQEAEADTSLGPACFIQQVPGQPGATQCDC